MAQSASRPAPAVADGGELIVDAGPSQQRDHDTFDDALRWWKGNTHTHTLWSDGDDFPEMVTMWYRQKGYHFLGLSDHNVLSQGQKWMKLGDIERRGGRAPMQKYLAYFGAHWVETRGEAGPSQEVRLKPLGEYRALVEAAGEFIMIQSEEISDRVGELRIHLNAANLLEVVPPQGGSTPGEVIENNVRAVNQQARRTGQEMLVHLNHPNFVWSITAEDIAEAISEPFFEVFNGHPGVNQRGSEIHPPIERLWDIANTLRITKFNAPPLYGVSTDDSHHYHVHGKNRAMTGRGWIMVRARQLTPESLLRAMKAGDFYASTGVTLRDVRFDEETGELSIEIEPQGDARFTTHFIGTLEDADVTATPPPTTRRTTHIYSEDVGATLATVEGLRPTYRLTGRELYVRALIVSSELHDNPVWDGQLKQAWTQPVGWKKRVPDVPHATPTTQPSR